MWLHRQAFLLNQLGKYPYQKEIGMKKSLSAAVVFVVILAIIGIFARRNK